MTASNPPPPRIYLSPAIVHGLASHLAASGLAISQAKLVRAVCSLARSPGGPAMMGRETISPRLRAALSDLGFATLEIPAAQAETYACRRLLGEAAMGRLNNRAAARTVLRIAEGVRAADEAGWLYQEARR